MENMLSFYIFAFIFKNNFQFMEKMEVKDFHFHYLKSDFFENGATHHLSYKSFKKLGFDECKTTNTIPLQFYPNNEHMLNS